MSILELLRSDGSIVVNKKLAHAIGIDAAIMYSELISKHFYFEARGQLTEDGFYFNTVENMQEDTALSKYQQTKAIKKLVELKLIFHQNRGVPQKRYFKINDNETFILRTLDIGQKLKNSTSKSKDIKQIKVKKVNSNNTKNNTKEINKGLKQDLRLCVSFLDYKNQYSVRNDIEECIDYYMDLYRSYIGMEHPRLKEEQWGKVAGNLFDVDGMDISDTDMMTMMEQHFRTRYKDCDYNILHFMSGEIRLLRMYEVAY